MDEINCCDPIIHSLGEQSESKRSSLQLLDIAHFLKMSAPYTDKTV